ncbi:MAG: alpha-amylase family glycosyl hydrolase [Bacteroidales bacterium]|nr:alpha-amylase family glycosyl hydrolase [Bacteroidales bacterium]
MNTKITPWAFVSLLLCSCAAKQQPVDSPSSPTFSWDKATVYFLITDRFCNGDSTNDIQYGRCVDYGSERLNAATFHGGDYAGIIQKAKEGYFTQLGIDAVWLTDPYEQIHGWVPGSGWVHNEFPHFGYHGYYPLDYTQMDKNYGTIEEYRTLINLLHSQGIRVMSGANINDCGYPTFLDAIQQGYATVPGITTEAEAIKHNKEIDYNAWLASLYDSPEWFTRQWLREPAESSDFFKTTLYGLPDYLSEKTEPVDIPLFLQKKWQREGNENDAWTWPAMKALRQASPVSPCEQVIRFIAAWVEEFGLDGFRCDVVQYVEPERWGQLHRACNEALTRWRKNHPEDPASKWTDEVMFTGDYEDAFITRIPSLEKQGFGSMVNMMFPKDGNLDNIIGVWQQYADSMQTWQGKPWYPFSYLNNAYFRETSADNAEACATTFLLSPGAIQIFYGDEVNRPMTDAINNVDRAQAFRSDYRWDLPNPELLSHYQRLGQFRQRHAAVGKGCQQQLDAKTVLRTYLHDNVVISLEPQVGEPIPVGTLVGKLRNAYTGEVVEVTDGHIILTQPSGQVALIEPLI